MFRKKSLFLALPLICVLGACSSSSPVAPPSPAKSSGWQNAGFQNDSLTIREMISVGTTLVLRAEGAAALFVGDSAGKHWRRIPVPEGFGSISRILGDSTGVFVGSRFSAKLYRYDLLKGIWENQEIGDWPMGWVYGLSQFGNDLALSVYRDDNSDADSMSKWTTLVGKKGEWKEWKGVFRLKDTSSADYKFLRYHPKEYLDPWLVGKEWNGRLYVASTEHGVWHRSPQDSDWQIVPSSRLPGLQAINIYPRSLAIWNDDLIVGHGVFAVYSLSKKHQWTLMNNCIEQCREVPRITWAIHPYRGRLYIGGEWWGVMVHSENSGKWVDLDDTTWTNGYGGTAFALVGIGDTLYAAETHGVYKFPLSKVPD